MPDASYLQTSFLGGEWAPYAQGRLDHPAYRTAMALCLNAYPVEEGACPRRPGFAFVATTLNGAPGRVLPFNFTDTSPYTIELTDGALRLFAGRGLVFTPDATTITAISTTNPAVITLSSAVEWVTADQVQFLFQSAVTTVDAAILRNRQFVITVIDDFNFSIADPITGAGIDGSTINFDPTQLSLQAARVLQLTTPFTSGTWSAVRRVQAAGVGPTNLNIALLLSAANRPQALEGVPNAASPDTAVFTLTPQDFADGPYLDIPSNTVMTPNALSGNITLTLTYPLWSSSVPYTLGDFTTFGGSAYQSISEVNLNHEPDTSPLYWVQVNNGAAVGSNGFVATDVGRSIRLLSEPAPWAIGTGYAQGTNVKFNGLYYSCISANTGNQPDVSPTYWVPSLAQTVFTWTWGKIVSITSTNVVVINLYGLNTDGTPANLLYIQPIQSWQIGAFSDTTGWPTCGCYYEGRLFLSGVYPNRLDGSVSNDFFNFSPTAQDGTVGDANAVSATFDSDDENTIYFVEPMATGLMCGTKDGEWLVQASTLQDPITPTSIQAHRHTKVGCFNQIPCKTPLTTIFINKYQRQVFEYFPDVFSGKMTAPNLNVFSKHLTSSGIEEVAYQAELAPIVWGRMGDGSLVGWTYRRVSCFSNEEPKFVGAHREILGSGRLVESICTGPNPDQTLDALYMVTNDPVTGIRHVEISTALMDQTAPITASWFVDDSVTPSGLSDTTGTGVTIFGLWHLNGKTVSAVIGGLDCGDYLVTSGSIFVPYQSDPGKLFTLLYVQQLSASGVDFGDLAVPLDQSISVTPAQNPTPQIIQEFQFPNSNVTGGNSGPLLVDWPDAKGYLFSADANTGGIRQINLVSGQEIMDKTMFQIFGSNANSGFNVGTGGGFALGLDGNIYGSCSIGNQIIIAKVKASTLTFISSFGADGTSFTPSASGFTSLQGGGCAAVVAGANYLVECGLTSAETCGLAAMNTDTMTFVAGSYTGNLAENRGSLVAGAQGAISGEVFAFGNPTSPLSSINLYCMTITGGVATQRTIGTVQASAIDASWSQMTKGSGLVYDQSDANIIVGLQTTGAASGNNHYIVKLRASDASIMWKVPVNALPGSSINQSRTIGGVLAFMGSGASSRPVYVINTITGTVYNFNVINVQPTGDQIFDSLTGNLILNSTYSQTAGSPVPYVDSPTSWTAQWSRLTAGSVFFGTSSTTTRYSLPAVVGFTYTTQGQLLRQLSPQEAGAANGPALGKTRRQHMIGLLLSACIYGTLLFGTSFSKLRGAYFKSPGANPLSTLTLFGGVFWDTLEDNYTFDSQFCWQITRPVPGTVCAVEGFIHTQDR